MKKFLLLGYDKYKDSYDIEKGHTYDINNEITFIQFVYLLSYICSVLVIIILIYLCFIDLE
jgi:hypothetical protein